MIWFSYVIIVDIPVTFYLENLIQNDLLCSTKMSTLWLLFLKALLRFTIMEDIAIWKKVNKNLKKGNKKFYMSWMIYKTETKMAHHEVSVSITTTNKEKMYVYVVLQ